MMVAPSERNTMRDAVICNDGLLGKLRPGCPPTDVYHRPRKHDGLNSVKVFAEDEHGIGFLRGSLLWWVFCRTVLQTPGDFSQNGRVASKVKYENT